ncbi:hypothetical protein, partial [Klebsiella pneumoniae]|uniref:hypothetical protein n=2 Tax=Enterobacteriaceae TaxID=543 RepID=UPI00273150A4
MFVRSLIRMSKLRYGVQVAWSELPDQALFLLPWRLRPTAEPGGLEFEVRTHVDLNTVDRLASRYRRHWLIEAPEDASTLGLVTSTTAGKPSLSLPGDPPLGAVS